MHFTGWTQRNCTPCRNIYFYATIYSPYKCGTLWSFYTFYNTRRILNVQGICLCFIILMTQNNSAPCSVGHFPQNLSADTLKSSPTSRLISSALWQLFVNQYPSAHPTGNFHTVTGLVFKVARQVGRTALVTQNHYSVPGKFDKCVV